MSRLTAAGRRIATEAIAKALVGGSYVNYDGDGRELVRCAFPDKFEMVGDSAFRFDALPQGTCIKGGMAVAFAAFPPGERQQALIGGTIGRALSKHVHAAMDDQQLYPGMLFDVDEFSYTMQFTE